MKIFAQYDYWNILNFYVACKEDTGKVRYFETENIAFKMW